MQYENDTIGFLQVNVKTANGALPVENARVSIYQYSPTDDGGNGDLIYSLETNSQGRAPRVALPAKSRELSMSPSDNGVIPYTTYNVLVSGDGFYDSSYINVPIFQNITAIQPVELIPLLEFAKPNDDFPNASRRFAETPNTDL
ncbi:MAG: hypothetical protein J6B29_03745 [Clostridia bacterium]|nr:hypothetical protein [Clostridia bacterium]